MDDGWMDGRMGGWVGGVMFMILNGTVWMAGR